MLIALSLILLFGAAAGGVLCRALCVPGIPARERFYRCLVGLIVLMLAAALLFFGFLGYMQLRSGPLH